MSDDRLVWIDCEMTGLELTRARVSSSPVISQSIHTSRSSLMRQSRGQRSGRHYRGRCGSWKESIMATEVLTQQAVDERLDGLHAGWSGTAKELQRSIE